MEDLEYNELVTFLESDTSKRVWPASISGKGKRNYRQKCSKYLMVSGTVHYKSDKFGNVRVIKLSEKDTILHACHKAPTAGHLGVNKTTQKIAERYYWPGLNREIRDYIGKFYISVLRICSYTFQFIPHEKFIIQTHVSYYAKLC